jgi:hypothetical protein
LLAAGFAARRSSLLRPPPTPSRLAPPFPGSAGYGRASLPVPLWPGRWSSARPDDRAAPGPPVTLLGTSPPHVGSAGSAPVATARLGPRRASPVPRTAFWPFNTHYAGEFLGTRSRFRGAFRGLRLNLTGSAPSWSASRRVCVTTLSRVSLPLQTGQLLAPFQGLCHSASTAGSRPTSGAMLPGTLASPRARLALAGCPELVARVVAVDHPLSGSSFTCAPSWLDAPGCRKMLSRPVDSAGQKCRSQPWGHRQTSGSGLTLT